MTEHQTFLEALAGYQIFWVVAFIAVVLAVGSLVAGWTPKPGNSSCQECSMYGGGHYSWCSRAFARGGVS